MWFALRCSKRLLSSSKEKAVRERFCQLQPERIVTIVGAIRVTRAPATYEELKVKY